MSLTGRPLLVLLAVLAVGFPVATFVWWSRLRGPRPVRAACRLALLLAGQLATLMLAGVVANNYGQFYTSWSDLLGGGHVDMRQATVLHAGGRGSPAVRRAGHRHATTAHRLRSKPVPQRLSAAERRAMRHHLARLGDTSFSTRATWATRGRVQAIRLTGPQSGLSAPGYIYLPPQYFRHAYAHHLFPAVEVLTGYPGSTRGQVGPHQDYPGHALAAMQAHRAGPMIYVFLRSAVVQHRDTECTNIPGGPQAQTYLAHDVPTVLQAALRVRPHDWGILGDSTGGYCATKILMGHHHTFRTAVALSGYYHTLQDVTTGDLWGGRKSVRHQNDPEWLLKHRPAPPVSLLVTISKTEATYADTVKFLRLVKPPMQVTAIVVPSGGHNFVTWGDEMPRALSWMSRHLHAGA